MAASKKSIPENLENYILAIEKRESNRRLTLIFLIVFLVVASGGATLAFLLSGTSPTALKSFALHELNYEKVENLIASGKVPIFIRDEYGNITDSIHNLNDYDYILIRNMAGTKEKEEGSFAALNASEENVELRDNSLKLPVYPLDIEGQRISDGKLVFTVVGYESHITYRLDLGNGVRRTIGKKFEYKFTKPGTYNVKLTARSNGYVSSEFRLPVRISKNPVKQDEPADNKPTPATVITQNTEDKDEESTKEEAIPEEQLASENTENTLEKSATEEVKDDPSPNLGTIIANAENDPLSLPEVANNEETSPPATTTNPNAIPSKDANLPLIQPKFPGGTRTLANFISRRLNYPEAARRNGVEGKVYVTFVVDKDGEILNPQIIKGLGFGCDEEVLRIIKKMPKWIPASQGGTKLSVPYTLPITFRLQ